MKINVNEKALTEQNKYRKYLLCNDMCPSYYIQAIQYKYKSLQAGPHDLSTFSNSMRVGKNGLRNVLTVDSCKREIFWGFIKYQN